MPAHDPNALPPDRRADAVSSPTGGIDVDDYVDVAPDPDDIVMGPEDDAGGSWVDLPGERQESAPPDDNGFYDNLAATLPSYVKTRIVTDLLRKIEQDKEAREKRDKQYEEGLKRTGMGKDAPGGADFEGASRVVHPMMAEACVDYNARIMKEIFPPSGPVKPKIIGVVTDDKTDRAKRKTEHMNYQITTQIIEARSVLETTFTQVPLGGSQFIHLWWDHRLKRPRMEFRAVDKMYIPFGAADFRSASRRTFEENVSAVDFKRRVKQGLYIDTGDAPSSQRAEPSRSETANNKIQGLDDPGDNQDGDRTIYETMVMLEVTEDMEDVLAVEKTGDICPYLITMDFNNKAMVAMYRCWEEGDTAFEPIEHDFEFPFLPWRGALSIGFPQLIGGLSATATGALRALLDSALVNTSVSGLYRKGSGMSGQSVSPAIGSLVEIELPLETMDIRQAVMPFPFNQPSPVLFQLLGFVVEAARGVVRTSMDDTPNQGPSPVPVGTQMSRVEEGLVVFSAIHGRAHAAFNHLLMGLHRLNRLYLPETLKVDAGGKEIMVRRSDYEGPCDIQPVSDPTIYSDQQRWAQINYIQSRMMVNPALWKARDVELAGLKLIKWADPESLLVDMPEPVEENQVNECLAMSMGKPVQVFPHQNHLAHLSVLMDFIKSPMLGMNPILAPVFLPAAVKHAGEHIAYLYVTSTVTTVAEAAGMDTKHLLSNDPEVKSQFDGLLATASQGVIAQLSPVLQQFMPTIQAAMAQLQAMAPKPPMDPAQAAVQAAAAETQRKTAADQATAQLNQQKLQLQQQDNAIQADRVAAMREGQQLSAQTTLQRTALDNQTAQDIAEGRIESGQGGGYRNGESLRGM